MSEPTTTEQRKDEMYAAQTMSGHLTRRIYESQVRGDSLDAIVALMDQKASLDARVQLLSHEIHNEVTYAGLGTMLSQVLAVKDDILAGQARLQAAWEETALGLKKQIDALVEGQDQLATQVSNLGERTDEHATRIEMLEAGRTENYQAIQAARTEAKQQHIDLSDQIREMQQTVARFSSVLVLTDDALITIDDTQHIVWTNAEVETLFGYATVELLGQPIDILIPTRFRAQHMHDVVAFGHGMPSFRRMAERQAVFGLRKDGREILLKAAISWHEAGGATSYTVVLRQVIAEQDT